MTQQHNSGATGAPDWHLPLWDTDGFPHALVAKTSIQAVTRCGSGFAVWNARTGALEFPSDSTLSAIGIPYQLRNCDLNEDERRHKDRAACVAWDLLHAEETAFCVASNLVQGKASHFVHGPYWTLKEAQEAKADGEIIFRVPKGGTPSTSFCEVCGCDTSMSPQNHQANCPNLPL